MFLSESPMKLYILRGLILKIGNKKSVFSHTVIWVIGQDFLHNLGSVFSAWWSLVSVSILAIVSTLSPLFLLHRYGFSTEKDYNDSESYCGGWSRQVKTKKIFTYFTFFFLFLSWFSLFYKNFHFSNYYMPNPHIHYYTIFYVPFFSLKFCSTKGTVVVAGYVALILKFNLIRILA